VLAAAGGHAETVEALLAAGGDAHREVGGETALSWARRAERTAVVSLLEARASTD
jgi:ankyrin repeat protein